MVVCGMAAVASAVIGAPVSGVLIMLEMTMSYEYALCAMLSVVIAALVSQHIIAIPSLIGSYWIAALISHKGAAIWK